MEFEKFETKYFDNIDSFTWIIIKEYCYLYRYMIDYSFSPNQSFTTAMPKFIEANWNNK